MYRIDGILGRVDKSEKNREKSEVSDAENAEFVKKISRHRLEKVLSRMESEFRGASFQHANVDLEVTIAEKLHRDSQEKFNKKLGILKPKNRRIIEKCKL